MRLVVKIMRGTLKREVGSIREFNRYYTNVLGLLDQHILDSPLSLSEVRVLYEIDKTENCTAKMLSQTLLLDPGYLSRMLKSFQKNGFIERYQSPLDRREQYLSLSPAGREKVNALNAKSDEQIVGILNLLSEEEREELVHCMKKIEQILEVTYVAE